LSVPQKKVSWFSSAGPRRLDVAAAELDAVAFEQPHLFFRDDERGLLSVAL
jgi:hypothetical protein